MNLKIELTALIILMAFLAHSQERLFDLYDNPYIKNSTSIKSANSTNETLSLPFFEDFSYSSHQASPKLWADDYVYVNNQYAIGPPSYGVATLDAVDGNGEHYSNASSSPFAADSLTSLFIDLSTANMDSVYLSFYYQPQGLGNIPEKNDSLLVQIKDLSGNWETIWYSLGDDYLNFRKNTLKIEDTDIKDTVEFGFVMLPINDPKFQHNKFQFRFVNYASIAGAGNPSWATNCDHWNVDYIYLDKNRTAEGTIFQDVAFIEAPESYMRIYTSVPWAHYPSIIEDLLKTTSVHIRNNGSQTVSVSPVKIYFRDNKNWEDSVTLGSDTISAFSNYRGLAWPFSTSPIPHDGNESAEFKIEAKLTISGLDRQSNNSIFMRQKFANYYAYDDGSAEKIYAHNTNGGSVAYRFSTSIGDSLRGVDMYFLRNNPQEEAAESFVLCVWADDNGLPGRLLTAESGKKPKFGSNINDYVSITLDSAIYIKGPYFVGWQQVSDSYLNVGFDKNTDSKSRTFFNFFGNWEETEFNGSLMMRPLFGAPVITSITPKLAFEDFKVYPNPAKELIHIEFSDANLETSIEIFNLSGQMIHSSMFNGQSIDISLLKNGLYLVSAKNAEQQFKVQRLIIAR